MGRFQFSIKALLIATTIVAIPVAGVSYIVHRRNAWLLEVERLRKQDIATVEQIVIDVDAACERLGRAPENQAELESLMGRPMPTVHDGARPTPIHYVRTSPTTYMLQYELWATDDWIYDSANPKAGWVQHWY